MNAGKRPTANEPDLDNSKNSRHPTGKNGADSGDAELAGVGNVFFASKLIPGAGRVNVASELGARAYYMG